MIEEERMDSFKFKTNIPETVTFLYDNPRTGKYKQPKDSQTDWYRYTVVRNAQPDVFFASELLHKTLIMAKVCKNTTAIIIQKQREKSRGVFWEVNVSGNVYTSDDLSSAQTMSNVMDKQEEQSTKPTLQQICNRWLEIWDIMSPQLDKRELPKELQREVITSVFIQSQREGISFLQPIKPENQEVENTPPEDIPIGEPDLPF